MPNVVVFHKPAGNVHKGEKVLSASCYMYMTWPVTSLQGDIPVNRQVGDLIFPWYCVCSEIERQEMVGV